MTNISIDVSDVDFSYDKSLVLENISLSIEENSFVALIGPNGGGKSTLLKLMMGLIKPNKGSIKIFGENPVDCKYKIGYVPQGREFDPKFPVSVFDVVLMGFYHKLTFFGLYPKDIKNKAKEALESVGLKGFEKHSFGTLSGGQAQRVLIARALLQDPQILFLDEPTASIDQETQKTLIDLLLKKKSSMTIVMVTHQIEDVISHVNKVFTVQQKVTELKPDQVCKHFALGVYHDPLIHKGETCH